MKNKLKARIRIAALTCALLYASVVFAFAGNSYAESVLITINLSDRTVAEVLETIENETEFNFYYNSKLVDTDRRVSVHVKNKHVYAVLDQLFSGHGVYYKVIDRDIILTVEQHGSSAGTAESDGIAQNRISISGTVTDAGGEPVIGANVVEKGTANGTVTNVEGAFAFSVSPGATLEISFIGYVTKAVPVGNNTSFFITLDEDTQALDEVVVVGYGVQKKLNLTGSVASVKGDAVAKSQSANVTTTLAGQLPGIIAKQTTGSPGSGADIYIRGVATYRGGTSPAYIIDGIERQSSDFARIDPNEIESINVLKDAASAAVFGMRGANGVIVVTTKRGVAEKPRISYSGNLSVQRPTILPRFAGSADFAGGLNKYMGTEIYSADEIRKFADGSDPENYPNTDWYGLVLSRNATQQTHNVSVNGGAEKIRYFINFGYIDQRGMWERLHYDRYSLRVNLDAMITSTTQLSLDLSGRLEHNNGGGSNTGIFQYLVRTQPTMLARYSNGLYAAPDPGHEHPLTAIDPDYGYSKPRNNSVLTRMEIVQELPFVTQGLKIRGVLSYDKNNYASKNWTTAPYIYRRDENNPDIYNPVPRGSASLSMSEDDNEYREYQGHLTYDRTFGDHSVSGLAMALAQQADYHNMWVNRNSFDSEAMDQIGAGNTTGQTLGGFDTQSARLSYVGRVNYAFRNKYLFEGNVRRDASQNFSPRKRWGTFASLSAGWVVSEESFWNLLRNKINFLKFRASYGTLGSDNTGGVEFPFYSRFELYGGGNSHSGNMKNNLGDYPFGELVTKGLFPGAIANVQATWETSTKTNLAVDAALFDKINFSFDYFYERRTGILAQRSAEIPGSFGATLPLENFGEVKNQGIEALLSLNHQTGNVRFSLGGNFTYAWNEIVEMAEAAGTSKYLRQTGRPIHSYFGYRTDGIFRDEAGINSYAKQEIAGVDYHTQPGDIKYVDVDENGVVNSDDRTFLGYGNVPEIIYGINGSLNYRNVDFSFLFQGASHVQLQLTGGVVIPFYNDGNLPKFWVTEGWSESNMDTRFPRLAQSSHNFPNTDFPPVQTYLFNASYLRLKNVEMGYMLPAEWRQTMRLNVARIYFSAQNLFTFTGLPQVDPENSNVQGWAYPLMKSFNIGINIQF
jgi:TonB-linked SusC/RagA family outer membrane protein